MGFDDGSVQVRNIRDPGQPAAKEQQEHMTTHRPYRSWCKILCDGARCERAAQEIRCSRRFGGSASCINAQWGFLQRGNPRIV